MKWILYNPFYIKIKNIPEEVFALREFYGTKIDSTGQIKTDNVINLFPLEFKNIKNFNDIFTLYEKRINEIKNKNLPIRVFWSGGLDSTLIILLLLNYFDRYSDIEIILTKESIRDFEYFFEKYVKNNFKFFIFKYKDLKNFYLPNQINITGDGAEELCGSNFKLMLQCFLLHNENYHLKKINELDNHKKFDSYWLKLYNFGIESGLFKKFNRIPKTIIEIAFIFILNFNWQHVYFKSITPFYDNLKDILPYHFPFFVTDYFRFFAIQNFDNMISENYYFNNKIYIKNSISKLEPVLKDKVKYKLKVINISYKNYVLPDFLGYTENYKRINIIKNFQKIFNKNSKYHFINNDKVDKWLFGINE